MRQPWRLMAIKENVGWTWMKEKEGLRSAISGKKNLEGDQARVQNLKRIFEIMLTRKLANQREGWDLDLRTGSCQDFSGTTKWCESGASSQCWRPPEIAGHDF